MGNAGRVLMIPKGEYNSATTYEMLDFVYYQGRSYVCKQTSTGNVPTNTTYWQALTGDASAEIQALTNYVAENNVKNVYDIPSLKALSGRTHGGITYTVNSDGTVSVAAGTVNGTESVFPFGDGGVGIDSTNITRATHVKPNTKYIASFGVNLGAPYYIQVFYKATSSSSWTMLVEGGSGTEVEFTVPSSFYDIWIRFNIYGNGTAVPAMTLYPMIREAGIGADGSYQPYAKTNVELTQDVADATDVVAVTDFSWDSAVDGTKSLSVKRMGHLVFVQGYFESTTQLTNWKKIVTGLPAPLQVAASSDAISGINVNVEPDAGAGALVIQAIPAVNTRVRLSLVYLA